MNARTEPRWQAVSASVMGASHQRSGLPNQDAVTTAELPGGLVAVVADGHGGARYVRSDVGSAMAVAAAVAVARSAMEQLGADPATAEIARVLTDEVPRALVDAWRAEVAAHHRAHPFTDEERARGAADLDADPHMSYGATLVLALLGADWAGFVQIGDGDLSVVLDGGRVDAPVPGDERLVGGETTSLCLPTAAADARVAVLREPLPELVVLTSDGYANSFADPGWRTEAGLGLRDAVRRDGLASVAGELPGWLAESATASGDDVSMALVRRLGPPGVPPAGSPSSTSTHGAPPGRTGRGVVAAAAAVGLLAAGAAGGWFLGRASDDETAQPTPTTAVVTTSVTPATTTTTTVERLPNATITVGGTVIGFTSDPDDPAPRVIATVARPDDAVLDGDRWRLDGDTLEWRNATGGSWRPLDTRPVGAVTTAAALLWLVDPGGTELWSVDPVTRKIGPRTAIERTEVVGASAPTTSEDRSTQPPSTPGTPKGTTTTAPAAGPAQTPPDGAAESPR